MGIRRCINLQLLKEVTQAIIPYVALLMTCNPPQFVGKYLKETRTVSAFRIKFVMTIVMTASFDESVIIQVMYAFVSTRGNPYIYVASVISQFLPLMIRALNHCLQQSRVLHSDFE